mmetsp:Transcript_24754/g.64629  ORF Transcript_24754/g.64629 Transcript_24754/m.64629 type:complete len:613 (-) Transcript_24754:204-2042(-)
MMRLALLFLCGWMSVTQCSALTMAQVQQLEEMQAANVTKTSWSLVNCYYSTGGRPLSQAMVTSSIAHCMSWASGYTYMGFGCPHGSSFECWRGNSINGGASAMACQECGGQASYYGHCTGPPLVNYNGVDWLVGGWHREPVYTQVSGSQGVFCPAVSGTPNPTPYPTPYPTPSPTPSPTALPTPSPTPSPTYPPTPAPTSQHPWMLFANVNPCDGANMGYAGPWASSTGSAATALTNDFVDSTVGTTPVKYITIARHSNGACEMSKTWELTEFFPMQDYFNDLNPGRIYATGDGSASDTHVGSDMPSSFDGDSVPGDPIFSANGGLVFNWWYSNNGARIAVTGGYKVPYTLPSTGENNDDLHGLGNELGANTQAGEGSSTWWHDAAKIMGDCHGTSCQVVGTDHGTAWGSSSGPCWGSYAIYVSTGFSSFTCQGTTLAASIQPAASGAPAVGGVGGGGSVAATGDPHLQNLHGERFDLMKPGKHILINIPRKARRVETALLRVEAEAQRLGGPCAELYFQELNITGAWAEAKQAGGFGFRAGDAGGARAQWLRFGKVGLKVAHGHTTQGIRYLNLYVRSLGRAGYDVGGLLGEDDHTGEAVVPEKCARRLSL